MELLQAKPTKSTAVRRSQRILITVHVVVSGNRSSGEAFVEDTMTQVVNAHGALVLVKQRVNLGDLLRIRNVRTGEEISCKVIDVGEMQDQKCGVGLEFEKPNPRFWRIAFPPEDWSPRSEEAKRFTNRERPAPKTS